MKLNDSEEIKFSILRKDDVLMPDSKVKSRIGKLEEAKLAKLGGSSQSYN